MKRILGIAITSALVATSAMAANMENPLFIPRAGQFASKTGFGLMYKQADHTDAMKLKGREGATEFPVWRFTEDFGYGFTDRLSAYISVGWTQNNDIERKGMHRGRAGLNYRVVETWDNFVWDLYGEGYLSGITPMKGSAKLTNGHIDFKYNNFSNGRWGAVLGTRVGKTWHRFTASLFAEYLQTFGNHNNKINTSALSAMGFPDEISVNLKSTNEITVGTNAFYQLNDSWSFGGGFRFVEHTDNGVKSIYTDGVNQTAAATLLAMTKDMDDGWDEYIVSAVVANQITDRFQIALFGEYTFDHSHKNSQNGTDIKAEVGVRLNVVF